MRWIKTNNGGDMVYSTGKFYTNPELHALTKVAGEVFFSVDVRSLEQNILDSIGKDMRQFERTIGTRNCVDLDLGKFSRTRPAFMDSRLIENLHRGCIELEIPRMDIVSGGGHDAVEFSLSGIPSAMIFLRNENGSHNPDESIDLDDFQLGTSLLTQTLLTV
jgi:N-carbamoyl-L-amino-acid hydrolase